MKGQVLYKIVFLLLLIHIFTQATSVAQRDITGLWKGSLYNDTTKQNLPYEIAISEEAGKLSGYSYTLFDIDGRKELGVKKINISRKDDQLTIEDAELISNTYSAPPPKKVRQQSVVHLVINDTVMQLTGKWSTNRTRQYLPLTGSLLLEQAIDFRPMVLFKLLESLKLDNQLSFVKAEKKSQSGIAVNDKSFAQIKSLVTLPPADIAKSGDITALIPEAKQDNNEKKPAETSATNNTLADAIVSADEKILAKVVVNNLSLIKPTPSGELVKLSRSRTKLSIVPFTIKKKEPLIAVSNTRVELTAPLADKTKTASLLPPAKKQEVPLVVNAPVKKEKPPVAVLQTATKDIPKIIATPPGKKEIAVTVFKEPVKTAIKINPVPAEEKKKEVPITAATPMVQTAAVNVSERKMKSEQSVFFESDSLVLTLYDNGDVDGDTVSVLMNGQIIFARQGLSTKANSKTIYLDKGMPDSISMVMYAENLGSIPPNTGLMIIMDGDKRYEVRFSADLKTNAAILLRRKAKEK